VAKSHEKVCICVCVAVASFKRYCTQTESTQCLQGPVHLTSTPTSVSYCAAVCDTLPVFQLANLSKAQTSHLPATTTTTAAAAVAISCSWTIAHLQGARVMMQPRRSFYITQHVVTHGLQHGQRRQVSLTAAGALQRCQRCVQQHRLTRLNTCCIVDHRAQRCQALTVRLALGRLCLPVQRTRRACPRTVTHRVHTRRGRYRKWRLRLIDRGKGRARRKQRRSEDAHEADCLPVLAVHLSYLVPE
jgi:hypothetical protein